MEQTDQEGDNGSRETRRPVLWAWKMEGEAKGQFRGHRQEMGSLEPLEGTALLTPWF
jgi:hypothetical protein